MAPKARTERITSVRIDESDWDIQEDENDYHTERLVKHVGFTPGVQILIIMPRHEYTAKEIKACWYSLEAKAKMNARHEKTVARFESGKPPKRGQTYRGLECWSVAGARELESTITTCIDAVMDEQDRQWKLFFDDYDELAEVSMRTSGPSKQLAWEMAQLDAQAVAPVATAAPEEGGDVSSSETGSDALNETPVAVSKKERRRSEKNSRSHTKKGRRKDPPGNITRDASQNASDVLRQMAGASRKYSVRKVSSKKSPIRGQGLARTRSK